MRAKFTTTFLLASLAATSACVTSRSNPTASVTPSKTPANQTKAKPLAKEGQKTQQHEVPGVAEVPATETPLPIATDLNRTFNRLNDPTMQLMDEDIRTATALHPTTPGSMEEAVLVLAQLRLLKIQTEQTTKFQSRDLYEQGQEPKPAAASQPSMEKLFKDLNINLVNSFNQNNNLKNLATLGLVKSLLDHTSNSASFDQSMQSIIDVEASKWTALQKPARPSESPEVTAAASAEAPSVPVTETSSVTSQDIHTAATDLKRSDAILMASQKLADKGEFKQAIDQAARIDNRDPFFDQAKEKIKVYSNRAVQDLRQKAAQAFQNAMPVADNRAKAAYLKQARDLLEQALKDYPTADQLDTVRDNLAVISRDLSGIDQDAADNTPKTQ